MKISLKGPPFLEPLTIIIRFERASRDGRFLHILPDRLPGVSLVEHKDVVPTDTSVQERRDTKALMQTPSRADTMFIMTGRAGLVSI